MHRGTRRLSWTLLILISILKLNRGVEIEKEGARKAKGNIHIKYKNLRS